MLTRREMASSSSSSPCAACKFLRRKCTAECVFAPYFPPDQPHKFASVHKIFGASNITKLLNELPQHQREDAVNSLAYEAEARMKDPVYGCVGAISVLQRQVQQLQRELAAAHADLARYAGSTSSPLGGLMGMSLNPHSARDHRQQILQPPQFTREQLLEFARVGGSYEAGLAVLGMAASLNIPYPPSTTASDGASGSSGGGPSMGRLSPR